MPKTKAAPVGLTGAAIAAAKAELGSWRAVADRFNLGSPSAARRTYTELTGKSHSELNATPGGGKRATATNGERPPRPSRTTKRASTTVDPTEMTTIDIGEAITGRTLVIKRGEQCEEMQVAKVRGFHVVEKPGKAAALSLEVGDLCVEFVEGRYDKKGEQLGSGAIRTIAIKSIREVKK